MQPMEPVTLSGQVTRFKGNGRRLGYPTANLTTATDLKDGVYFGFADLSGFANHPAMIFVGTPTTMGDTQRRVEAYLLDIPDQDYYDQSLRLKVCYHHRANETFATVSKLLEVIQADETTARQWFATHLAD